MAPIHCDLRDEVTMTRQHIGNMVHHKGQSTQWKLIILVNQSGNSSSRTSAYTRSENINARIICQMKVVSDEIVAFLTSLQMSKDDLSDE